MEEIDLALRYIGGNSRSAYDLTREPYIAEMIERIANGEDVFVKFSDTDKKRPGAIAKIRKFEGTPPAETGYRLGISEYKIYLKWDDRKNTAQVKLNDYYHSKLTYLRGYTGKTVWSMFDAKKYAEKNAKAVYDRLNCQIQEGNTVVYINTRYGSGATLDFGVVKEIKYKASKDHRGNIKLESKIVIETIATNNSECVETSNIKTPEKSIMIVDDVNLLNEAFVAKLSIDQKKAEY